MTKLKSSSWCWSIRRVFFYSFIGLKRTCFSSILLWFHNSVSWYFEMVTREEWNLFLFYLIAEEKEKKNVFLHLFHVWLWGNGMDPTTNSFPVGKNFPQITSCNLSEEYVSWGSYDRFLQIFLQKKKLLGKRKSNSLSTCCFSWEVFSCIFFLTTKQRHRWFFFPQSWIC